MVPGTRRAVKRELRRLGISQRELARQLGVSPSLICRVLRGTARSARIERALIELALPGAGAAGPA